MNEMIHTLLDDIEIKGWGLMPMFLTAETATALKKDLLSRQAQGQFHQASIGKDAQTLLDIRGDETLWWEENDLVNAQEDYYQNINILQKALNQAFFLGLESFECHYACYPTGAFYKKHLDSFRKSNLRVISCILYLNDGWRIEEGGQLRIYKADTADFVDIQPLNGTMACLLSDRVWHEVLPATRLRYSITGWLKKHAIQ